MKLATLASIAGISQVTKEEVFLSAVRITDPDARTVSVRQFLGEAREAEPQAAASPRAAGR